MLLADDMAGYWLSAPWIMRERRLVEDMLAGDMSAGKGYLESTAIGAHFAWKGSAELVGVCEQATEGDSTAR